VHAAVTPSAQKSALLRHDLASVAETESHKTTQIVARTEGRAMPSQRIAPAAKTWRETAPVQLAIAALSASLITGNDRRKAIDALLSAAERAILERSAQEGR
jgi:uncharacterized iron-regulated protein